MANVESQIEASLEQLQMDERLRSNLIDTEASLLLDWATTRLTNSAETSVDEAAAIEAVRAETRRVKAALRNINALFNDDQNPAPPAALTALGLSLKPDPIPLLPDRTALLQWLLDQLTAAWNVTSS
jgi:hypothetical protein